MLKAGIFILFLECCFFTLGLANVSNTNDTIPSDSLTSDNFSSFTFGTDYSSNTNTFGKFSSFVSQPILSPYISFYHKSGLLLSGLVSIIANSDSASENATYQFNLKGGYQFKIFKDVMLTPSYTRYFYDKNALSISTLYENYADVNLSMQKTYWYGSLSGGYLWGRVDELSIDARLGANYSWDNVLFKDDALLIQGNIIGFFNNPNYLSKVFSFLSDYAEKNPTATKITLLLEMERLLPEKEVRIIRRTLRDDKVLRWMARDYIPNDITLKSFLNYNNRFTLTSLAFSLPITYIIGNFSINMECSYYRMLNQPVYYTDKYYFYFTASLSYSINW